MIVIPKTSYVGHNIKSCLPDCSKTPDLVKIVYLNHPFSVKTGKKSCRKLIKLSLNYLYFNINVTRKCIGIRLDKFDHFLQQKRPCWGKFYKAYYLFYFYITAYHEPVNIFEYKFINHFTAEHFCYFYFIVHKNVNTQPILSISLHLVFIVETKIYLMS